MGNTMSLKCCNDFFPFIYRNKVLYRLPKLKFLDSSQVRKSDLAEAQRVGPYTNVVRGNIPNENVSYSAYPSHRLTTMVAEKSVFFFQ